MTFASKERSDEIWSSLNRRISAGGVAGFGLFSVEHESRGVPQSRSGSLTHYHCSGEQCRRQWQREEGGDPAKESQ